MSDNITPVILTAKEIELHFGEQIILDKASLSIHQGDRIGLVGKNGAGKTSFLKIISDIAQADAGEISKKKDLSIGFLPQDFALNDRINVYDNILDGAKKETELLKSYEETPFDSPNKSILEHLLTEMDSWNLEKRINILIDSLNASEANRSILELSGGEKRRVALCRSLISKPELLILDEPTNHLDTKSIEWLENFLSIFSGTCIFVTHDRYFLDRIANRIVELSNGVFFSHVGNYTDFLLNKSLRNTIKETEEKKRRQFLVRELEWIRRGPKARRTKAKSRIDKFNEIATQDEFESEIDVDLIIPPAESLGKKVLELKNVSLTLGVKKLVDDFSIKIEPDKKIGIIGSNGIGKTSFLKLLLGELTPSTGKIEVGDNVKFNYVDQSRLTLDNDNTVINAIGEGTDTIKFGKLTLNIWTYLRRFLFTDDRINTLVGRLSGGEKSRLTLAKILATGGNFIILDEPTNDLDLSTLRILEEALLSFEGCVFVVSHDRYFLNRVCSSILAFEGNGQIYYSEGDYDYYLEKFRSRNTDSMSRNIIDKKTDSRVKQKVRKLTYKESIELNSIEENILHLESEVERIEAIFSSPDFFEKYASKTNELNLQLEEAKEAVNKLYLRWEELEEIKNSSTKL